MALTEQERMKVLELKNSGMTVSEAAGYIGAMRAGALPVETITPQTMALQQAEQGMFTDPTTGKFDLFQPLQETGQDILQTGKDVVNTIKDKGNIIADAQASQARGEQGIGDTALQTAGALASAIPAVGGDILKGAGKALAPQAVEDAVGSGIESAVQSVAQTEPVQSAVEKFNSLDSTTQDNLKGAAGLGEMFLTPFGGVAAKTGGEVAGETLQAGVQNIGEFLSKIREGAGKFSIGKDVSPEFDSKSAVDAAAEVFDQNTSGRISMGRLFGVDKDINIRPEQKPVFIELTDRGLDNRSALLIATLDRPTKNLTSQMLELSKTVADPKNKAQARIRTRPIDLVGEETFNVYQSVQAKRQEVGKRLGEVAKGLQGQQIDTLPLVQVTDNAITEFGVIIRQDGGLDFSKSPIKNIPTAQKRLQEIYRDVRELENDPQQVHNFKKAIDEVVNFGSKTEGLSGQVENILKGVRRQADELLDNNFDEYRQVNDEFAVLRQAENAIDNVFGKNLDKQRMAQNIRGIFSNRQTRGELEKALARLQETAKIYGIETKVDILDAAEFASELEKLFGTQAVTSLQGEVDKAISGSARIVQGLRNPVEGIWDAIGTGVEKALKRTDEDRIKALELLFKQTSDNVNNIQK